MQKQAVRIDTDWCDGLRGLAALIVMTSHTVNLATAHYRADIPAWMAFLQMLGRLCVPTFIFLSGFLLTLPCVKRGMRLGSIPEFFERRANRILPSYFAALVFALVVAVFVTHEVSIARVIGMTPDIWGPFALLQDYTGGGTYDGPIWSLAPECHIYLIFPVMLIVIRRLGVPIGAAALVAALLYLQSAHDLSLYLSAIFLAGSVLAWYTVNGYALPSPGAARQSVLVCLLLFAGVSCLSTGYPYAIPSLAFVPALASSVIWMLAEPDCALRCLLMSRPMLTVGAFSYSLYLVHWPVLAALQVVLWHHFGMIGDWVQTVVIGLPLALAFAYGFYWIFERPYLKRRSSSAPAVATCAPR